MAGKESKEEKPRAKKTDEVTVRAKTPIRHNGVDYAESEEIVMTVAQAEPLIASGAAE